jgi:serine phosphatase RsbU (regulator of sigma subunit)
MSEKTENPMGMAHCLNSIGAVYKDKGDKARALDYWYKSMALWEKTNDMQGMILTGNHIALVLLEEGKVKEAQKFAERSLKYAQELGYPESIKDASFMLSKVFTRSGNWKGAYDMQVLFKQMSDSIMQQSSRKTFLQKTFQYEYEKKATADSIRAAGQRKLFDAEIREQKTQRTALYCGIALIALFAIFMYNRFRATQKQKQIIELKEKETQQQKQIIEEKHKEISDSINYAERIQRSFLATEDLLDKNLKDYFILFQPKATVSGDFYWGAELEEGAFAFVTADSTGHGVPGAIMSLLNITSLEKAIEHSTAPAEILNYTRTTIIERLRMDGSQEGGKDGMDCSFMIFNTNRSQLEISTAQNPIWIVRGNGVNSKELIEAGTDKMPVGKHARDQESFTQKIIPLQKGDMIYAVTDGFADQFGGPKGKKFMYKQLKELLISISGESVQKQKELLSQALHHWIGNLEQVDDITVAGIRIS